MPYVLYSNDKQGIWLRSSDGKPSDGYLIDGKVYDSYKGASLKLGELDNLDPITLYRKLEQPIFECMEFVYGRSYIKNWTLNAKHKKAFFEKFEELPNFEVLSHRDVTFAINPEDDDKALFFWLSTILNHG